MPSFLLSPLHILSSCPPAPVSTCVSCAKRTVFTTVNSLAVVSGSMDAVRQGMCVECLQKLPALHVITGYYLPAWTVRMTSSILTLRAHSLPFERRRVHNHRQHVAPSHTQQDICIFHKRSKKGKPVSTSTLCMLARNVQAQWLHCSIEKHCSCAACQDPEASRRITCLYTGLCSPCVSAVIFSSDANKSATCLPSIPLQAFAPHLSWLLT